MATLLITIAVVCLFLFCCFFIVPERSILIIQRFGSFNKVAYPGLNIKIPLVDLIAGRVNLRVQQLDVKVETKTEDNVFIHLLISVQYHVHEDKIYEAFYKLQNPNQQITSFVFDVVRASVPKIKLDDVFEKKDEIANNVMKELAEMMRDFGYVIVKTLVTDIEPDEKVKASMNEINAAQRLRIAANEKGEAERILKVKQAQGEAESKALQGQGVANQRRAIVEGLRSSIADFHQTIPGSTAQDVMSLVILTQYFDMLREVGGSSHNSTIFVPHSPGGLNDLVAQVRDTIISANKVAEASQVAPKAAAVNQESQATQKPPVSRVTSSAVPKISTPTAEDF